MNLMSQVAVGIIPIVLVPLTFLFVLLIILIVKAPKAGAWVIGGLLLLAPMFLWRLAAGGAFAHEEAIPLFVIPATFLFVLLIILLTKAPKAGVGLIVAIVAMVVLGLLANVFVVKPVARQSVAYSSTDGSYPWAQVKQQTEHNSGVAILGDPARVYESFSSPLAVPAVPAPTPAGPLSPIWSEGVDEEFEADVYPSNSAAARALGRRMADPIRTVVGDPNVMAKIILFQESNNRSLVAGFGYGMEKELPGVQHSIEADLRNILPGEVGVTFRVIPGHFEVDMPQVGGKVVFPSPHESTRIVATARRENRSASAEARFIDKPWVESFGAFASERPDQHFIVVRSNGTCTSESEANQQALEDAKARLTQALGKHAGRPLVELAQPEISTTDVLNGGFVVDRFVQSLDGSAGKIWRQAMLIDVSGPKLSQLAGVKLHQSRQVRESWARMGFSAIGVLVLISVIYFFLNMATRGYYEWSLRIAGVVLAIVAIVSILMIVQ